MSQARKLKLRVLSSQLKYEGQFCQRDVLHFSIWYGEPNMCGIQEECAFGCNNSYGRTTAEMMQQSTFENWDFINIWAIGENQTYLCLPKIPSLFIYKGLRKIANSCLTVVNDTIMSLDWPR